MLIINIMQWWKKILGIAANNYNDGTFENHKKRTLVGRIYPFIRHIFFSFLIQILL
jgi:hypothetical protein